MAVRLGNLSLGISLSSATFQQSARTVGNHYENMIDRMRGDTKRGERAVKSLRDELNRVGGRVQGGTIGGGQYGIKEIGRLKSQYGIDYARLDQMRAGARQLRSSLNEVNVAAMRADKGVAGIIGRFGGWATAGYAAVRAMGALVTATDRVVNVRNKLKTISHITPDVGFGDILAISSETYQDLDATALLYQRIAASTKDLGYEQEQYEQIVRTLNQTLRISGTVGQEAAQSMRQLAQGFASNRLGGDEFRSVSEANIRLLQIFADHLGVTRGELREMAHAGKLTADVMAEAIIGAFSEIEDEAANLQPVFSQLFGSIRDEAVGIFGRVFAAPAGAIRRHLESIRSGLRSINEVVDASEEWDKRGGWKQFGAYSTFTRDQERATQHARYKAAADRIKKVKEEQAKADFESFKQRLKYEYELDEAMKRLEHEAKTRQEAADQDKADREFRAMKIRLNTEFYYDEQRRRAEEDRKRDEEKREQERKEREQQRADERAQRAADRAMQMLERAAERRRERLSHVLSDAVAVGMEQGSRVGAKYLLNNIQRALMDQGSRLLVKWFADAMANRAGTGGFAGAIGNFLAGYSRGADFMVGGRGGTDQNIVAFRASHNERVRVTTPQQEKMMGGAINIYQNNSYNGIASHQEMIQVTKQANDALEAKLMTARRQGRF